LVERLAVKKRGSISDGLIDSFDSFNHSFLQAPEYLLMVSCGFDWSSFDGWYLPIISVLFLSKEALHSVL
jgi:hypothetical protein